MMFTLTLIALCVLVLAHVAFEQARIQRPQRRPLVRLGHVLTLAALTGLTMSALLQAVVLIALPGEPAPWAVLNIAAGACFVWAFVEFGVDA